MTRNLFRIHGGKYYLAKWIISHFPPHQKYIEGCLGAGSVFYNKPYVPTTLYETHFNIWCIHYYLKYIQEHIQKVECSEDVFNKFVDFSPTNNGDIALKEYILRKMSRVGNKRNFSQSTRLRGGRPEHINSWENSKDLTHFMGLAGKATIKWESILKHRSSPDELIYVDPPYVHSTRSTHKEYGPHEWADDHHRELIQLAKTSPGMWFISGYPSSIYEELGWKCKTKEMPNHASQSRQKGKKIECLWSNTF